VSAHGPTHARSLTKTIEALSLPPPVGQRELAAAPRFRDMPRQTRRRVTERAFDVPAGQAAARRQNAPVSLLGSCGAAWAVQAPLDSVSTAFTPPRGPSGTLGAQVDWRRAMGARWGHEAARSRVRCKQAVSSVGRMSARSAVSAGLEWNDQEATTVGAVMKPLVAVKVLLVVGSFAAWSNPATAQNLAGVKTGNAVARVSSPARRLHRDSPQSSGQFHSVCVTDRGATCGVTSTVPILPDTICHCGPNVGSTPSSQ
jgi:hypothetical protein